MHPSRLKKGSGQSLYISGSKQRKHRASGYQTLRKHGTLIRNRNKGNITKSTESVEYVIKLGGAQIWNNWAQSSAAER